MDTHVARPILKATALKDSALPTSASDGFLELRGVSKSFAPRSEGGSRVEAIQNISFTVDAHEVVSIIGPSGCGKSTLLNLISGLEPPNSGKIFLKQKEVSEPSSAVAFMLQKDLLLPWRSIQQNVEFGLEMTKTPKARRTEIAAELLNRFGLKDFARAFPTQLSGGMRQRAALARTMALQPDLLLLDEPLSAVDAQTRLSLQRELALTLAQAKKAALLITHDLSEAVLLSDRVLVMSPRPGRIISTIDIQLPARDDPFQRRKHPSYPSYIEQLWDLLHINESGATPGPQR